MCQKLTLSKLDFVHLTTHTFSSEHFYNTGFLSSQLSVRKILLMKCNLEGKEVTRSRFFFFSSIAVFTIRSNSCCLLISSPTSTHLPFFYWHTIKTAHLPCTWSIIFFIRTQKLASRGLSLSSARLIYPVAYTTPELHLHGRYLKWTNNLESQRQMWHLTAYTRKYSEHQNVDTLKFTIMGLCGRSSCPILCRRKY